MRRILRNAHDLATWSDVQRILYRTSTARALQELFASRAPEGDPTLVTSELECELPVGETHEELSAGSWVLAVFETSPSELVVSRAGAVTVHGTGDAEGGPRAPMWSEAPCHGPSSRPPPSTRATCAPAQVVERDGELRLRLAVTDWQRILCYVKQRLELGTQPRHSERVAVARAVRVPSEFPAAPLPQVETLRLVHCFDEPAAREAMADAMCGTCHGFESGDDLLTFSQRAQADAEKIDGFVFGLPADETLSAQVGLVRAQHPDAAIVCLVSGVRPQAMRALFSAGADEILQAQTPAAEVAVTLLALVRRKASKDALGAA